MLKKIILLFICFTITLSLLACSNQISPEIIDRLDSLEEGVEQLYSSIENVKNTEIELPAINSNQESLDKLEEEVYELKIPLEIELTGFLSEEGDFYRTGMYVGDDYDNNNFKGLTSFELKKLYEIDPSDIEDAYLRIDGVMPGIVNIMIVGSPSIIADNIILEHINYGNEIDETDYSLEGETINSIETGTFIKSMIIPGLTESLINSLEDNKEYYQIRLSLDKKTNEDYKNDAYVIHLDRTYLVVKYVNKNRIEDYEEEGDYLKTLENTSSDIVSGPDFEAGKYFGVGGQYYEWEKILKDLDSFKEDGINLVMLAIPANSGDEEAPLLEYWDDDFIKTVINKFHSEGFKTCVMLFPPQLSSNEYLEYEKWKTGDMFPLAEEHIIRWAKICEKYNVEILCPFYEPQGMFGITGTRTMSSLQMDIVSEWSQIYLKDIREHYSGKVAFHIFGLGFERENNKIFQIDGYDLLLIELFSYIKQNDQSTEWPRKINELKHYYPGFDYLFMIEMFTGPDCSWYETPAPINLIHKIPDYGLISNTKPDDWIIPSDLQDDLIDFVFNMTWKDSIGYIIEIWPGSEYRGKESEDVVREWFNK